jgi:hypothetical protein
MLRLPYKKFILWVYFVDDRNSLSSMWLSLKVYSDTQLLRTRKANFFYLEFLLYKVDLSGLVFILFWFEINGVWIETLSSIYIKTKANEHKTFRDFYVSTHETCYGYAEFYIRDLIKINQLPKVSKRNKMKQGTIGFVHSIFCYFFAMYCLWIWMVLRLLEILLWLRLNVTDN